MKFCKRKKKSHSRKRLKAPKVATKVYLISCYGANVVFYIMYPNSKFVPKLFFVSTTIVRMEIKPLVSKMKDHVDYC